MLNFGFGEIAIIVVLALVVVGPERLPHTIRWLGRQYGKLMRASEELRRAFVLEADRMDADKRAADIRERRQAARKRAEEARAARAAGTAEPDDMPTLPDDAAVPAAAPPQDSPQEEPADAGDAAAEALAARGITPAVSPAEDGEQP